MLPVPLQSLSSPVFHLFERSAAASYSDVRIYACASVRSIIGEHINSVTDLLIEIKV
jgi:hypothetical protein